MVSGLLHNNLDAFRFYLIFQTAKIKVLKLVHVCKFFPKISGLVIFIGQRLFLQERQP